MFEPKDLKCLLGELGFKPSKNPSSGALPSSVALTRSGLFLNDYHSLVSQENIEANAPLFDFYQFPIWAAGTYKLGDKVEYNEIVYEAIRLTGQNPDSVDWVKVNFLYDFLNEQIDRAIQRSVAKVFNKKKLDKDIKSILEKGRIFSGVGNISDLEIKSERFVGIEIVLKGDYCLDIKSILTQFSEANGVTKLYVYHSSQYEPIKEIELNLSKAFSLESSAIDFKICNSDYDGGAYFLGYFESDIKGQALNKMANWAKPCGSCGTNYYRHYSSKVCFKPFGIATEKALLTDNEGTPIITNDDEYILSSDSINNGKLWELSKTSYYNGRNFGMNLEFSLTCDVSDFICNNSSLFSEVIGYQFAVNTLEDLVNNTRENPISRHTRELAILERPKLEEKLMDAIDAVDFDLSNLSDCLPCKTGGVRVKSI
jgi:hypothetical protein